MGSLSVVRAWIDCYNDRRVENARELFTEDAIHEEVPEGMLHHGWVEIRRAMEEVLTGFPDLDTMIVNSVVEKNKVAVEVAWRGTHKGEFRGARPSGKTFALKGVFIVELNRGRMRKVTEYYDTGLLTRQLT